MAQRTQAALPVPPRLVDRADRAAQRQEAQVGRRPAEVEARRLEVPVGRRAGLAALPPAVQEAQRLAVPAAEQREAQGGPPLEALAVPQPVDREAPLRVVESRRCQYANRRGNPGRASRGMRGQ